MPTRRLPKSKPARVRTRPAPTPSGDSTELQEAVPSLDAEDIALAHLQAQLRRKEAMASARGMGAALARTMIRLPSGLLSRTRRRAQQEGVPLSEIVQRALETFLR